MPEVVNFLKAYGAKYAGAVPDALAALAYDATNLLLQAIKEAGTSTDTDKVKAALEKINFNGVSGNITFDASHNPVKSAPILAVKGGKIVVETVVNP